MLPPTLSHDGPSRAEDHLFLRLKHAPGTEDWICLHSLWLARHHTKRRAEIDFLLITPRALLALEVKGGGVSRKEGVWSTVTRFETVSRLHESPLDQASGARFALSGFLDGPDTDARFANLRFGCGVIFPDVTFDVTDTGIDPAQVYDYRARHWPITRFVERLTRFVEDSQPRRLAPGAALVEPLADLLRGDFELVPSVGAHIQNTVEQQLELTTEQYRALDDFEDGGRLIVEGGAGTGKTLLALEAARREASRGRTVLVVCFNLLLARHLADSIDRDRLGDAVRVQPVHRLMRACVRTAGGNDGRPEGATDADWYWQILPERAARGTALGDTFDTLVIDEGQDFLTGPIVHVLDNLVSGGFEAGRWVACLDRNHQSEVFGRFDPDAFATLERFASHRTRLSVNCRNTALILNASSALTGRAADSTARVEGRSVWFQTYQHDADRAEKLEALVRRLLDADISPGHITLLHLRTATATWLASLDTVAGHRLVSIDEHNLSGVTARHATAIGYGSVSAFKGLENHAVILVDVDDLESSWSTAVVHAGMTRARAQLAVLTPASLSPVLQARQQAWIQQHLAPNTSA